MGTEEVATTARILELLDQIEAFLVEVKLQLNQRGQK